MTEIDDHDALASTLGDVDRGPMAERTFRDAETRRSSS